MKTRMKKLLAWTLVLMLMSADICAIAEELFTITLPKSLKTIEAEAFYGDASVGKVVVPEGSTEIGSKAFANSSLTEINLPGSIQSIANDAFVGSNLKTVTATKGTYAYDWAVKHGYIRESTVEITKLNCSIDGEIPLNKTAMWAVTAEADSDVQYQFVLLRRTKEVARQDYSAKNFFRYTFSDSGDYTLQITCMDEDGNTAGTTSSHTVQAGTLKIVAVTPKSSEVALGDEIVWQTEIADGREPIVYAYELSCNGTIVDTVDSSESAEYRYTADKAGGYVLNVTCIDANATIVMLASEPVLVVGKPVAPTLKFSSSDVAFSVDAASTPVYDVEDIDVSWDAVQSDYVYKITLDQQNNDQWERVYSVDNIQNTNCRLSKTLFPDSNVKTKYRFGIASVDAAEGDFAYSYFAVQKAQTDTSIKIEGSTTYKWNQAAYVTNAHRFTVQSDLEWTATSDADWLVVEKNEEDILVRMTSVNGKVFNARTGTVTVSNGKNTATLLVTQGYHDEAATVMTPELSTNEAYPTDITVGSFVMKTSHSANKIIRFYEKTNSEWRNIGECIAPKQSITIDSSVTGIELKPNTDYRIRIYLVYDAESYAKYEFEEDILYSDYYVHTIDSEHFLTMDGRTALNIELTDSVRIKINSSKCFTWSSDSDWLYCSKATYDVPNETVSVRGDVNDTEAARTGHITFTNGTNTAILTVTQTPTTPRVLVPENLSTNSGAPTIINCANSPYVIDGLFFFTYRAEDMRIEYLENGEYISHGYSLGSIRVDDYACSSKHMLPNTLYRITTSCSDITNYYYLQFTNIPSSYDGLFVNYGDRSTDVSFSSAGGTEAVRMESTKAWTASSDSSWLSVSKTSGSATTGEKINVTAKVNTSSAARTGTISLKINGVTRATIIVSQDGTDKIYGLYDDDTGWPAEMAYESIPAKETTMYVYVYSTNAYSVTTNAEWLKLRKSSSLNTYETLEDRSAGSRFGFVADANSDPENFRTGTITVTCGNVQKTFSVTQEPGISAPVIISPSLSQDYENPSVIEYDDVVFRWNPVQGASYYKICNTIRIDNTYYDYSVQTADASTCELTLPKEFISYTAVYNEIDVFAINEWGNTNITTVFFNAALGDKAIVDGSTAPVWENAYDLGDQREFTVEATGAWTAQSKNSWIAINKTSGSSSDTIQLTLSRNTGSAREGRVEIDVNGTKTSITVRQCAALPQSPAMASPVLSDDRADPSIISAGTNSITVTWDPYVQVEPYSVVLTYKAENKNVYSVLADSDDLPKGTSSYTFNDLTLEKDKFYRLVLKWSLPSAYRRDGNFYDAHAYYFILDDDNAYLELNTDEIDLDYDWDYDYVMIDSSGTWTAETDDDWIMVSKHSIDESYVDEYFEATDYSKYVGSANQSLCISVLPNDTEEFRTGTVTLRCGSITKTITVVQDKYYALAELIEPQLSATNDAPTLLPYAPLTVYWSKGEGGTGKYSVSLYESDSANTGYSRILFDDGITGRSYVIPEYKFTENKYYKLYIGTEVAEDDYYIKHYYFRIDNANPLRATLTLSGDSATVGSHFGVTVSASGGAGDYRYAYQLLRKGEIIQQSPYETMTYYSFATEEDDIYTIRVYVKDSTGNVITVDSDDFVANQPETAVLSGQVLSPEQDYGDEDPYGIEGVTVTLTPKDSTVYNDSQNWALMSARSNAAVANSFSITAVTDAHGRWICDKAIEGVEYIISYTKNHFTFPTGHSVTAGSGYTSAGNATGLPTDSAIMPDPVVLNYNDRDTINLNALPSGNLVLNWVKPQNAVSYIYAVKLLDGVPQGGDNEPGISLSGTSSDRNVYTTNQEIIFNKSELQPQKWLKVWIASVSKDGLRAQNTVYLYLSNGNAPGEVTFEGYTDRQTIYLDEMSSDELYVKWSTAENTTKYLVTAKILDGEPTSGDNDKAIAVLYPVRTELVDGDHFNNYPARTVPFAKRDLQPGKWLKIAVAAVNAVGVERWSILNLRIEASRPIDESGLKVVNYYKPVTSGSSYNNFCMYNGDPGPWKNHKGNDIATEQGTAIFATRSGTVTFAGWGNAAGWEVIIKDDMGIEWIYMHMLSVYVKSGSNVEAGTLLGFSGRTGGSSYGQHLHLQANYNSAYLNTNYARNERYADQTANPNGFNLSAYTITNKPDGTNTGTRYYSSLADAMKYIKAQNVGIKIVPSNISERPIGSNLKLIYRYPQGGKIKTGSKFQMFGAITSNSRITKVTVAIKNSSGMVLKTETVYPNAYVYDLISFNSHWAFDQIISVDGNYSYNITVTDASNRTINAEQQISAAVGYWKDPLILSSAENYKRHNDTASYGVVTR